MKSASSSGHVLLIGGSGFIGRHLSHHLHPLGVAVTGCARRTPGEVYFDMTRMRLRELDLDFKRFSHAVVLAAISKLDECAVNPQRSQQVNVESLGVLLEDLKSTGIFPIFTSTDAVFDGAAGNYSEEDPPHPILLYGKQKLAIEHFIQEHFPEYLILRLSRVYGSDLEDGTLVTSMLQAMLDRSPLRCARDQFFSPIHVDDVVRGIEGLIQKKTTGLYHMAGPESFNRVQIYEMLFERISRFRPCERFVDVCSIDDFDFVDRRPKDTSLRIEKLCAQLGFTPSRISDRIDALCAKIFSGKASQITRCKPQAMPPTASL